MSFSKNILIFFLVACVLVACSPKTRIADEWGQNNGKLKIVSTIAMIDDLVKQVGGEHVNSVSLIRGELDPHSYELVKGDDEKFARADLIFYNGLGLEHGLSLRQNLVGNPKAVAVADPLLEDHPDWILRIDGQYDPHIWMDAALWIEVIDPIVEALSKKDPLHASDYQKNAAALRSKMTEVDRKIYRLLQSVPKERRYLVTSHDAFHYFTRHYLAEPGELDWYKRCNAPEGLAPEAQLSVKDILSIIGHIENYQIEVLFPESNVSRDCLRKIVHGGKEKGLTIRLCQDELYGDSMGKAGSYCEMMTHNANVIARELSQ